MMGLLKKLSEVGVCSPASTFLTSPTSKWFCRCRAAFMLASVTGWWWNYFHNSPLEMWKEWQRVGPSKCFITSTLYCIWTLIYALCDCTVLFTWDRFAMSQQHGAAVLRCLPLSPAAGQGHPELYLWCTAPGSAARGELSYKKHLPAMIKIIHGCCSYCSAKIY